MMLRFMIRINHCAAVVIYQGVQICFSDMLKQLLIRLLVLLKSISICFAAVSCTHLRFMVSNSTRGFMCLPMCMGMFRGEYPDRIQKPRPSRVFLFLGVYLAA